MKPEGRALVIPVASSVKNRYGNLTRGKIKKLLGGVGVFQLGRREGVAPGIYRRLKGGQLQMLVAYEEQATYKRRINYYETGQAAFRRVVKRNFDRAFAEEMKRL